MRNFTFNDVVLNAHLIFEAYVLHLTGSVQAGSNNFPPDSCKFLIKEIVNAPNFNFAYNFAQNEGF